ncbi:hypothetical protein TanjilG_28979 [Lupinus angustifolius]|uniref:Uncharacterized protein n=1 Tax=Lupinus angustifolius TaxID=3871 RepID=A0A4P1RSW0_LUPAN|nr:PREDICTED: spermidine hydroxycinnamoyl transferase-like [Lupinus angustifolius]XP_019412744.1 PREDICTED: spermidine hydroxycinnamoyl transferase-like [Lupinus angustifolius]OIW17629.1 hypothetical protein TanjilG_28979 [Lupinus angustifolius]
MVSIKSSYIVIPNEPTPKGLLWLSHNDQTVRWDHTSSIYIYKEQPNLDAIEILKDSLSKILVSYYPIAGRLRYAENGKLELDCNTKGVELVEAENTKTLAQYGDFSPNETFKELIPKVDYTQPIEDIPLMLVQLTRFYGIDQGVAIGVSFSHPLTDGFGAIRFINSWAKLARGETLEASELFPVLDRSILKSPHPPSAPRFDHAEFKPLPLMLGSSDHLAEQGKKLSVVTLKLTLEQVEGLKKKANDESQKEGSRPYSRYEAIAAYIWRCASRARELDHLQPTQLRFVVDFRNRLNPPLPKNYFGNAFTPTVTPTCYIGDIISKPLSYVAQKIREATELIKSDYIWSQHDFIKCHEKLNELRPSFQFQEKHKKNSPFFGNPNLNVVSWMHMQWLEADFGWGKPMYFGPALVCTSDKAYLIRSSNDSIIISMHFQVAHMPLFIKFFWEDI